MRNDLINHIIKEKKVVIIHGLIFDQINFRKMAKTFLSWEFSPAD